MRFKVYRNDEFIREVEAVRLSQSMFAYIVGVLPGDALEGIDDGARLRGLWNNNQPGKLRNGLRFSLIENS